MLSLASVKAQRARLLGSFVALVLGVTMLTMTALLLVSAQPQVPQRFAAASIVVQAPAVDAPDGTFPEPRRWTYDEAQALASQLKAIPGITKATLDTPFYAQPIIDGKPSASTMGNSWTEPLSASEVVASDSLGLKPGDTVTILTAPGPKDYRVAAITSLPGLFFQTQTSFGVPSIALETSGNVDLAQVASVVKGQGTIRTGADRSALEPPADARTRWIGMQVLTAMGGLSVFVAIFLGASTFSFSVLQRRREFGLLRAVGATPGQLRRMMMGEALLLGAVAGACGVALGTVGAPLLGSLLVDAGFEPASFSVRYSPLPMAGAFVTGLAVALAGVWIASRRAARVRPLEALRVAEAERRPMTRSRWIGGAVALAIGLLCVAATANADALSMPTYAGMSVMALIIAISLLGPVLIPPLARVLMAPFARGAMGMLARQNAFTSPRRTAATAAPVLLTVAFSALVTGMVATGASAYAARRADAIPAMSVLVPDGTPGLTEAAVRAATGGTPVRTSTVFFGSTPIELLGTTDSQALADEEMTVGSTVATQHGWTIGSEVELTVANGQRVKWRVATIAPEGGGILVQAHRVPKYDPHALVQAVYLPAGAAGDFGPGAKVLDAESYAAEADAAEDRLVWMFTLILVGMSGGFSIIAVANTLLMSTAGRRRDLAVLRKAGATPRQVLWLMATETTLVVFIGSLLGLSVAFGGLFAIRAGLSEQIGQPVALVLPWPVIGVTIVTCLLAGLLASIWPARALPLR